MSKDLRAFVFLSTAFLLCLSCFTYSRGQSMKAEITIDAIKSTAIVSGSFESGSNGRNFYIGERNMAGTSGTKRISGLHLYQNGNTSADYRELVPGEFLASDRFDRWSYNIDLSPQNAGNAAHSTWVGNNDGLIQPADLLPNLGGDVPVSASVRLYLPAGWQAVTTEEKGSDRSYQVGDASKAVFRIGKDLRSVKSEIAGRSIELTFSGTWLFRDDEAAAMAAEIYDEYRKIFGGSQGGAAHISLMHFATTGGPGRWEAETRGRTITIVSSDMNFRTQSLQRLHEQLRHEVFHLWLPNAVALTGNYDWFYEGFALYRSLKMAVFLNRIRFDDFLDTLSRAYSIDTRSSGRLSLIDASKARSGSGDTRVYARGMLVAFLADISLLKRSKGKASVDDILYRVFKEHKRPNAAADGTTTVIDVMMKAGVERRIVTDLVMGSGPIEWADEIATAGLQPPTAQSSLTVTLKPTGRQKALLNKLGYNNWRKLSTR
ncbi:MAG TPA: hypothetical protein VK468_10230 [Pyrinomonadaceae bacterium]|nr:hypothetical protein [Pyrinomonadaceae bacterium]